MLLLYSGKYCITKNIKLMNSAEKMDMLRKEIFTHLKTMKRI